MCHNRPRRGFRQHQKTHDTWSVQKKPPCVDGESARASRPSPLFWDSDATRDAEISCALVHHRQCHSYQRQFAVPERVEVVQSRRQFLLRYLPWSVPRRRWHPRYPRETMTVYLGTTLVQKGDERGFANNIVQIPCVVISRQHANRYAAFPCKIVQRSNPFPEPTTGL